MEVLQDFMPVLVTCKFEEDPIKLKVLWCPQYFSGAQGQVLIQDFMAVLVTCKFGDDTIKTEDTIVSTAFSPLYSYKSIGKDFSAQGQVTPKLIVIWPKIELA